MQGIQYIIRITCYKVQATYFEEYIAMQLLYMLHIAIYDVTQVAWICQVCIGLNIMYTGLQ